jgi:preprotein translocase subunit SecY
VLFQRFSRQALLLLPTTLATFSGGQSGPVMSTILAYFGPGQPAYLAFFTAMIVFFTYFYTREVAFKTDEVADNLKNQNGFVPGIRPGAKTAEYLDYVVTRLLVLGSGYLALVCLVPEILRSQFAITGLFWRHLNLDHRLGGYGHHPTGSISSISASIRRSA